MLVYMIVNTALGFLRTPMELFFVAATKFFGFFCNWKNKNITTTDGWLIIILKSLFNEVTYAEFRCSRYQCDL